MIWLLFAIGCATLEKTLNTRYADIEQRYYRSENTLGDKMLMHATYRFGALGGQMVVPYASRILRRCINGSEQTLRLRSHYIKNQSPKIQETLTALQHKPDGTYRYNGFRQHEDWRLSMAFNPYNITLKTLSEGRQVTVWYDFDWPEPQHAYDTVVPVGSMRIRLNDGLVHVVSTCPTYRVEQSWILD